MDGRNITKTKLMKVSGKERVAGLDVDCGGLRVETVEEFKYLGPMLTADDEVAVLARIAAGTKCMLVM